MSGCRSCWRTERGGGGGGSSRLLIFFFFAFPKGKEPRRGFHPASDFQPRRCIFKAPPTLGTPQPALGRQSRGRRPPCVTAMVGEAPVRGTGPALGNGSWSEQPVAHNAVTGAAAGAGASHTPPPRRVPMLGPLGMPAGLEAKAPGRGSHSKTKRE